ncbi:MAG TPA: hypothetical protein VIA06_20250 [Candidatus Dormibacteraeota bacterium]|jgi:hypothetical protein|nr:hypothetical protein [Candidatus Dormibacteraeota bacterium]
MFRIIVLIAGLVILAGGVVLILLHATTIGIELAFIGLVVSAGMVFERARYQRKLRAGDLAGFEKTNEDFIDPATGKVTETWYNARSGERRYVPTDRDPV